MYIQYIPRTLSYVRTNLERYPRFARLRELLGRVIGVRPSFLRVWEIIMKRFGVSTHLYHEERLQKAHLLEIAANGFEAVEVFATRSHFDYHDAAAIRSLQDWLAEAEPRAALRPRADHRRVRQRPGQRNFSTATRDTDARKATLHEMAAALNIAKTIPFKFLVVHLGVPDRPASRTGRQPSRGGDPQRRGNPRHGRSGSA